MKALAGVVAVALVVLVGAFVFAPDGVGLTDQEQSEAEVRAEITSMADSYKDAVLRGDTEAVMSMYTPGVRVYWPGMNFTREQLQAFIEESFQTPPTEVEFELKEVFVHGDVAYVIFEWSETVQMEGQESESIIWNCFSRFLKADGAWKADRDVCGPRDAPEEG